MENIFKKVRKNIVTQITIPFQFTNIWLNYATQYLTKRENFIDNNIIIEIKGIKQLSQCTVQQSDQFNLEGNMMIEIDAICYEIYPGMVIDIKGIQISKLDGLSQGDNQNRIIQKILLKNIPCIQQYNKMNPSTLYQVTNNSGVKASKDYVFLFVIQQIEICYQPYSFTLQDGLQNYTYPQKEVEPKKKQSIANIIQQQFYSQKYEIKEDYTKQDFDKWKSERRAIIVPRERIDKTILVHKDKNTFIGENYAYDNLYWLINLQQEFINSVIKN